MSPEINADDIASQAMSLLLELLAFSMRSPHLGPYEREVIYSAYEAEYFALLSAFRHRDR